MNDHYQEDNSEQRQPINESLKGAGLSPEELQQILNSNPDMATQEFKQGIKKYIGNVAKRKRDPKTGRFLPGTGESSDKMEE